MAIAWRNTYERYGVIAKGLHWVVALLVSVQFATAALMAGACPGGGRGPGPGEGLLLGTHRSLGLLLLALTAVRALWRWAAGLRDSAGRGLPMRGGRGVRRRSRRRIRRGIRSAARPARR